MNAIPKIPRRKPYPRPVTQLAGCKVGWNWYSDATVAEKCAKIAKHNAELALAEGFDFGYQVPGTIDWDKEKGLYRVCLP